MIRSIRYKNGFGRQSAGRGEPAALLLGRDGRGGRGVVPRGVRAVGAGAGGGGRARVGAGRGRVGRARVGVRGVRRGGRGAGVRGARLPCACAPALRARRSLAVGARRRLPRRLPRPPLLIGTPLYCTYRTKCKYRFYAFDTVLSV